MSIANELHESSLHDGHDHSHHHGHDHDHHGLFHVHTSAKHMKKAFFLTLFILLIEILGGILSHSLALLSDAGHVVTDVAAIGLSWFALHLAMRPSNEKMTYGYYRTGILAALLNAVMLILITLWIVYEAINRFTHPVVVQSGWMLVSAAFGLGMNLYLGFGMRDDEDLNVKSAFLHMMGDAAASAGVIVAGIILMFTHLTFVDPLLSLLIAVLIAFGAVRILRQTIIILLEGTPVGIDFQKVVQAIQTVPCVEDVHDVHVWSIASGRNALSCHIVLDGRVTIQDSQGVLRAIEHTLIHMGIAHVTIQTEDSGHPHEAKTLCQGHEESSQKEAHHHHEGEISH